MFRYGVWFCVCLWLLSSGCFLLDPNEPCTRITKGTTATGDPIIGLSFCQAEGRCEMVEGECKPTSDKHCRASELCKEGLCSLQNGVCALIDKQDCLHVKTETFGEGVVIQSVDKTK